MWLGAKAELNIFLSFSNPSLEKRKKIAQKSYYYWFEISFFVELNFRWDRNAELLCIWVHMDAVIALVLQVIFRFIDCLANENLISAEKTSTQYKRGDVFPMEEHFAICSQHLD